MALIIYPTTGYDSFISVDDATNVIEKYSVVTDWVSLSPTEQEVYLRLACERIKQACDPLLLDPTDECVINANALMANEDVLLSITKEPNFNSGAVIKEKVGDIELQYKQGANSKGMRKDPFPFLVKPCLSKYGANFNSYTLQTAIGRS